jgi:hypothetical protein
MCEVMNEEIGHFHSSNIFLGVFCASK